MRRLERHKEKTMQGRPAVRNQGAKIERLTMPTVELRRRFGSDYFTMDVGDWSPEKCLSREEFRILDSYGFFNEETKHNDGPTITEMRWMAQAFPGFIGFVGYRSGSRIGIDGLVLETAVLEGADPQWAAIVNRLVPDGDHLTWRNPPAERQEYVVNGVPVTRVWWD